MSQMAMLSAAPTALRQEGVDIQVLFPDVYDVELDEACIEDEVFSTALNLGAESIPQSTYPSRPPSRSIPSAVRPPECPRASIVSPSPRKASMLGPFLFRGSSPAHSRRGSPLGFAPLDLQLDCSQSMTDDDSSEECSPVSSSGYSFTSSEEEEDAEDNAVNSTSSYPSSPSFTTSHCSSSSLPSPEERLALYASARQRNSSSRLLYTDMIFGASPCGTPAPLSVPIPSFLFRRKGCGRAVEVDGASVALAHEPLLSDGPGMWQVALMRIAGKVLMLLGLLVLLGVLLT